MADEQMLLTIFFRHDQSKNLDQIQAYLRDSGFWEEFPLRVLRWRTGM